MNIEQMKAVQTIFLKGTFTKAADALFITQPALSMQIRVLEKEIGQPVFVRMGRKVTLTDAGKAICRHADAMLAGLASLRKELDSLKGLGHGELSVAASDTVTRYFLLDGLSAFRGSYPGVAIRIWNKTSREIVSLVADGLADIGVLALPVRHSSLRSVELLRYRYVALTAARAKPAKKAVSLDELADSNLLLLEPGTRARDVIEAAFRSRGLTLKSVLDLGSVDVQKDLARIGAGVAIVPDFSVSGESERGLLQVSRIEGMAERSLGVIMHKTNGSITAREFLSTLLNRTMKS